MDTTPNASSSQPWKLQDALRCYSLMKGCTSCILTLSFANIGHHMILDSSAFLDAPAVAQKLQLNSRTVVGSVQPRLNT